MTPHKDPIKLPVDDQIKLLRNTMDEVASDLSFQGMRVRSIDSQVKILRTEVKDVKTEVKGVSKKIDKLYLMISKFVGRIDSQDKEIGANAARISRLEEKGYTISSV